MPQINPITLRMQVNRLIEQGQSMFASIKVQDWLKERGHNPKEYEILFHPKMAPVGSGAIALVEIELRRKDGEPVDTWLQTEVNRHS
ncbi:hypothetical protein TUMEXPCC7403_11800 [Tumidithrix helvetica PCC 7403]|uniref:hypothetical protein n=1 Tax=Tumidithrix helvetica TaxID=3457545 RepID=UPI003C841102